MYHSLQSSPKGEELSSDNAKRESNLSTTLADGNTQGKVVGDSVSVSEDYATVGSSRPNHNVNQHIHPKSIISSVQTSPLAKKIQLRAINNGKIGPKFNHTLITGVTNSSSLQGTASPHVEQF
jgi:hypothetical protein